jgi:hypothetical protein
MATTEDARGPEPGRRGIDALWRRSPFLLFRHPALLAAISVGALLLTLAVAAYPLFMSSTASGLLLGAIERPSITRYGAGLSFQFQDMPLRSIELFGRSARQTSPVVGELDEPFAELASRSPILGEPIRAVVGDPLAVNLDGTTGINLGRLFSANGMLDEVEILEQTQGAGVWVPDFIATELSASPGDRLDLSDPDDPRSPVVSVRVKGIYRALYPRTVGYWLPWAGEFRLTCFDCRPPPQPLLAPRDRVLDLLRDLEQTSATFQWLAPIADPASISLEQARDLRAYHRELDARMHDQDDLGGDFLCCQRWFYGGFGTGGFGGPASALTIFESSIGYAVDEAQGRVVAVEGPSRVLGLAGAAVALVVVAAAGAFSVRARRIESAWLFARGTSAAVVGVKTALESLVPCIVGGALGFGLAALAVGTFGPDGRVDSTVFADAALGAAAAVAAAVVLVSLVAAWTHVRVVDPHGRRFARIASLVPWELGIAALAFIALQRLRSGGAFVTDEEIDVVRPSLSLVAFPFLLLTGFAILAARLARYGFAALRRPTAGARPAPYLAVRRLAGGGAFTVLLVGAAALCLGTFLHAQTVSRSLQTTVEAKAKVFVGSDVGARVLTTTPIPEDFPYPITRAVEVDGGALLQPSARPLDLLAVDPETVTAAAYWHEGFADESFEEIVGRLDAPEGDVLPIVVAGGDIRPSEIQIGTSTTAVDIVATTSSFPGLRSRQPLIVVDEATLNRRLDELGVFVNPLEHTGASVELWIRGDTVGIERALADTEHPPFIVATAEAVQDIPQVAAVIDTFVVLNVLGLAAAGLTFVGILMYLQARQRSQVVSYALSTRMGMKHGQHRRALVVELGAMLALAFAVGAALAIVAAGFTVPRLDPLGTIPPGPLLVLPLVLFAVSAITAAVLTWIGAGATNRAARAVDLGEVMRVAE